MRQDRAGFIYIAPTVTHSALHDMTNILQTRASQGAAIVIHLVSDPLPSWFYGGTKPNQVSKSQRISKMHLFGSKDAAILLNW